MAASHSPLYTLWPSPGELSEVPGSVTPFKAKAAPATTSLFPLAQKFPAGIFSFFQEEWNETSCSVTAGFRQGLSRGSGEKSVTGSACQQALGDVPSVTCTGTAAAPPTTGLHSGQRGTRTIQTRPTHNTDEAQRCRDPQQTFSMLGRQEIQLGMSPYHEAPPSGAHTGAQEPCPTPGPSHSPFPGGSECSSTGLHRQDP